MDIMIYAWSVGWPLLMLCIWIERYQSWLEDQTSLHPVVDIVKTVPGRISTWWESLDESDD